MIRRLRVVFIPREGYPCALCVEVLVYIRETKFDVTQVKDVCSAVRQVYGE